MDTYQATYDAVRSRISNGDVGAAAESALRDSGISEAAHAVSVAYQNAASEQTAPSILYRPRLSIDGNQWCALYGDNLQEGVAGFGDSPELAMQQFNKNWFANLSAGGTE